MSDEKDDDSMDDEPAVEVEAEENQAAEPEHDAEPTGPASMGGFTILQIITWTNDEIEKCREKLENEPSGRILAYLQGKIPGCKFALKAIEEIFHLGSEYLTGGEKPCNMSQLTQDQILGAEKDMEELQQMEQWTQFLGRIQERAEKLKNYLLFEAKKSRDLDVHQGEYKGMITYQEVFDSIESNAEFWRDSIFKKRDAEEGAERNANDPNPALLPPGLPPPEEDYPPAEDYEESDEIDYDDLPEEGEVSNEDDVDPNLGMEA